MSTILDALRKVEEDNRARSTDARARLLSLPSRPEVHSSRQRRTPWLLGGTLVLAGFAAGAGFMFWGPHSGTPEENQVARTASPEPSSDKGSAPAAPPAVQPPAQPTNVVAATPLPPVPASTETVAAAPTAPSQAEEVAPSAPTPQNLLARVQPTPSTAPSSTFPPAEKFARRPARRERTSSPSMPAAPGTSTTPALSPGLDQIFSSTGTLPGQESPASLTERMKKLRERVETARAGAPALPEVENAPPPSPIEDPVSRRDSHPSKSRPDAREDTSPATKLAARTEGRTSKPSASPSAAPSSPPNSSLNFLQWSTDPDKRIAFIKLDGGPLTLAHEGDTVGGYTVVEIRQNSVELRTKNQTFSLQVEE